MQQGVNKCLSGLGMDYLQVFKQTVGWLVEVEKSELQTFS